MASLRTTILQWVAVRASTEFVSSQHLLGVRVAPRHVPAARPWRRPLCPGRPCGPKPAPSPWVSAQWILPVSRVMRPRDTVPMLPPAHCQRQRATAGPVASTQKHLIQHDHEHSPATPLATVTARLCPSTRCPTGTHPGRCSASTVVPIKRLDVVGGVRRRARHSPLRGLRTTHVQHGETGTGIDFRVVGDHNAVDAACLMHYVGRFEAAYVPWFGVNGECANLESIHRQWQHL